jgi:glycosyltransferase involved in cell wall biosynthesis
VLRALKDNPSLPLTLDLYGVSQSGAGDRHAAGLEEMIAGDTRIRLLPALPAADVIARLRDYDLLVVPSQWLETGPLVVLEAFAARIPVVGSNLGGIAELVRDGIDGLLVSPYPSSAAWATAFRQICQEPELLDSLRAGIQPPRHSRDAARELLPVYETLARSACTASGQNSR